MLDRGVAMRLADLQERARIRFEPFPIRRRRRGREELVEQGHVDQARAEALLVLGDHEQHLVDEKLRIARIVGAAEAEQ